METLTIAVDDREGLPSASNLERIANCPGSENLIKSTPSVRLKKHDQWASGGTRIHSYLASGAQVGGQGDLNGIEFSTAMKCCEQLRNIRMQVFGSEICPEKFFVEKRVWLNIAGKKVFSGQADRVEIMDDKALIVDWKSLYGDVEDAPSNKQLMALAVLWFNEMAGLVKEIWVAIVQPLVTSTPVLCRYSYEDLLKADAELHAYITEAMRPDAQRSAGDHCKWCPAKPHCPEARGMIGALVPDGNSTVMSPNDLGRFLQVCKAATGIIEAAQERAKELLSSGVEVPGWELKEGNEVRSITNPKEAYKALNAKGVITLDQFLAITKVPVGELEKAVKANTASTADEAKTTVNGLCFDWIEKKRNAPSLKQVKK